MAEFRLHGANPEKLYEAFGIPAPKKIYDFSSNTNVVEWNGKLDLDFKQLLSAYPDDESLELCSVITEQNNCGTENVLVTNGSNEAIYLLASYLTNGDNCLLQPLYAEYGRALTAYGAKIKNITSLNEISNSCSSVWICNPCNPTGKFIENERLEHVIFSHPETLFIVDEAYRSLMLARLSSQVQRDHQIHVKPHKVFYIRGTFAAGCSVSLQICLAAPELFS